MKKIISTSLLSALLLLTFCFLIGCERLDMSGMFWGSSPRNDERFAQSMEYNTAHGYRTVTTDSDTYKVYFASDFHVDSTTLHTQAWVQDVQSDTACAVAIILGDMVNGRQKYPYFMAAIEPLRNSAFPLFATAGNHDTYFSEWPEYVKHWGTASYYFEVQTPNHKDLYISIDSSDGTIGRNQLSWLRNTIKQQVSSTDYRHIICFTHTHMFKPDGKQGHTSNYTIEETYALTALFAELGVDWYVSGHRHARDIRTFKGVTYYTIEAIQEAYPEEQAYYMIATVDNSLSSDFVCLAAE